MNRNYPASVVWLTKRVLCGASSSLVTRVEDISTKRRKRFALSGAAQLTSWAIALMTDSNEVRYCSRHAERGKRI